MGKMVRSEQGFGFLPAAANVYPQVLSRTLNKIMERKETLKKLSFYKNETIDKPIIYIGAETCGLGAGADKTIHKTRQYLADKNKNKETLDKAIQTVLNGGNYYSEELFDFFTKQIVKDDKPKSDVVKLTRREKEILQLVCEGLSNQEIADILFVSERTIVGHKSNLLAKMGCKNTIGMMSYAIKNKLVVL